METRDGVGTSVARSFIGVKETPAEYVILRPKLYVDTSIPSYLTSRPSRDPQKARWQCVTREWWMLYRWQFDVYYSEYVEDEAKRGDVQAADERRETLKPFTRLDKYKPAEDFATRILRACHLPDSVKTDATHVALAAMRSLEYLLTWNCTHLANKHIQRKIMYICHNEGYNAPLILTPDEAIRLRTHEISPD
jgi:hypothetical protein